MKRIKKIILPFLCACLLVSFGLFTACSSSGSQTDAGKANQAEALSVVCTAFPQYDWVKQIMGDKFESADVTMLLDNGVDLHNYQPTADDIVKIAECDIFIYNGGESDDWVTDALSSAKNENMIAVNLMDVLGDSVREEETVEGMEAEDEHGEEDGEEETEYDEHIWLSLKNAKALCEYIADVLEKADPANADTYDINAGVYTDKLEELDEQYQSAVDSARIKTVLFGDRFPFRYLTDDYGLEYYAAFSGCSAETEASFETVSFLAGKADELGLHTVLTIEGSDNKIAQTIIDNTKDKNQQILSLDSLQSATLKDAENSKTYLSAMQNNLEVLKKALA